MRRQPEFEQLELDIAPTINNGRAKEPFLSWLAGCRRTILAPLLAMALFGQVKGDSYDPFAGRDLGPIYRKSDFGDDKDYSTTPREFNSFKYRPADTVASPNHYLGDKVQIEGFSIKIARDAIAKRLRQNEVLVISLRDPTHEYDREVLENSVIYSDRGNHHLSDPRLLRVLSDSREPVLGIDYDYDAEEGITYLRGGLRSNPKLELEIAKWRFNTRYLPGYKQIAVKGSLHLASKALWPVYFKPNIKCPGVEEKIISEVVIPADQQRRTCRNLMKLTGITPDDYLIFLDYVDNTLDNKDRVGPRSRTITLSLPHRRIKDGYDQSYGVFVHEAFHTTYYDLASRRHPSVTGLARAYRKMQEAMTYRMPVGYEQWFGYNIRANEPVWDVLTEAAYDDQILGDKDSRRGHGWDHITEMASSAAAIMATSPKELVQKYQRLNKKQQKAVRSVVVATLRFANAATGSPTETQKIIFPYSFIVKKFAIEPKELD